MIDLASIHAHLEWLRAEDARDPDHAYNLQIHVADDWITTTGLSRRQICDVVAAWLAIGFHTNRLTFDFADVIANDLHHVAMAAAPMGMSTLSEFHTPLSWEVYLAFDAGEYSPDPEFNPIEGNTRPLVADIVRRMEGLLEYPAAFASLG